MKFLQRWLVVLAVGPCILPLSPYAQAAPPGQISADTIRPRVDTARGVLPLRLQPGTPLRLQLGQGVVQGALFSSNRDTIFLRGDTTSLVAIASTAVQGIEYQLDKKQRRRYVRRGIAIGIGIGLLTGGVFGLAKRIREPPSCADSFGLDPNCEVYTTRFDIVVENTFYGVIAGGVVGWKVASVRSRRWRRHPLPRITVAPVFRSGRLNGAGASARLSWSFHE